jgi:hypothetical protein
VYPKHRPKRQNFQSGRVVGTSKSSVSFRVCSSSMKSTMDLKANGNGRSGDCENE